MVTAINVLIWLLWGAITVGLPIWGIYVLIKKYDIFPERESGKILVIEKGGEAANFVPSVTGYDIDENNIIRKTPVTRPKNHGLWKRWMEFLSWAFGVYGPVIPPFRTVARIKREMPEWKSKEGDSAKKEIVWKTKDESSLAFLVEIPIMSEDVETSEGIPSRVRMTLLAHVLNPYVFLYVAREKWYSIIVATMQNEVNIFIPTVEFDEVSDRWGDFTAMVKTKEPSVMKTVGLGEFQLMFEGIDPSGPKAEAIRQAMIDKRLAELRGDADIAASKKELEAAGNRAKIIETLGTAKANAAEKLSHQTKKNPSVVIAADYADAVRATKQLTTLVLPGPTPTALAVGGTPPTTGGTP